MYDDRLDWTECESEHFIYKYLPSSSAEKDLDEIINNRENAFKNISDILEVTVPKKIKLYLVPDVKIAIEAQMMFDAAVPHLNFASLLYNNLPVCREKISYGHEIAHLLAYYWDKQMYHLEILEEGLSVYLDHSGSNKHLDFINAVQAKLGITNIDLSLRVKKECKSVNYRKAGSLVKYLIETYGIKKFKKLYISSAVDRNGKDFYHNGDILKENRLIELLEKVYQKKSSKIQKEWLEVLGLKI